MNQKKVELKLNRIPIGGIFSFVILYYYSSKLYPGGSQINLESVGYDWINNYWCNLMSKNGINGQINSGRPFAIFAMIVLCFSVSIFFYQFAETLTQSERWKKMIKTTGILSMIFATLMFTDYHDLMIILSSLFGLIAVIGIIKEIYSSKLINYKITGVICMILLGINNIIYYSTKLIEWLPLIQKITFLTVLIWILGMNNEIRKKLKTNYNNP